MSYCTLYSSLYYVHTFIWYEYYYTDLQMNSAMSNEYID